MNDPIHELFTCTKYETPCKLTKRACLLRQEAAKGDSRDSTRYAPCLTCDDGKQVQLRFPAFNAKEELEKSKAKSSRRGGRRYTKPVIEELPNNPRLFALAKDIVGDDGDSEPSPSEPGVAPA